MFGKSYKRPWRTKSKHSSGSLRKPLDTRTGVVTSIYQIISTQPGLVPQVSRYLTHARLLADIVFVYHFSNY